MRITDMNWMQVAEYLKKDDLAVLPMGSTEQHCYLSLSVDSILASKVAEDAAEPLGIPVYPVMAYGLTPHWTAYPGTVTLRVETYIAVVRDILDSIRRAGFRRIVVVNGHGGNSVAGGRVNEWMMDNPDCKVKWHDWWNAPNTWAQVQATDPQASHASWMENFPWTRLPGVTPPDGQKPMTDMPKLAILNPAGKRELIGDGNMGGKYQRSDEEMLALWDVAVKETRELFQKGWE